MISKRWTWPAAVAVLFAGLTNAHSHVHYCFDGQEPPAAVHLADSTAHAHEDSGHHSDGSDHDDLDLDVPNKALAKAVKHDLPAITPVLVWTTTVDSSARSCAAAETLGGFPATAQPYAHPQLRAPPH